MIRRRVEREDGPGEFWLIAQHDHAQLAGELAAAFGNERYASPARGQQTVRGVAMHDAGWPIHDDQPQLNDEGLPSDVFETPIARGVSVWEVSAARAEADDPYAGLLVSIHVQRLAARADREPETLSNRERFWLIRFRNDQAQRQMRLRESLGFRVDRPLDHGLPLPDDADAARDPAEQRLVFDVRLLQAMDMLSLCLCCTEPPATQIGPLSPRPGEAASSLQIARPSLARLTVDPWPFHRPVVTLRVPYRPVPARPFARAADLHAVLGEAPACSFEAAIEELRRPFAFGSGAP